MYHNSLCVFFVTNCFFYIWLCLAPVNKRLLLPNNRTPLYTHKNASKSRRLGEKKVLLWNELLEKPNFVSCSDSRKIITEENWICDRLPSLPPTLRKHEYFRSKMSCLEFIFSIISKLNYSWPMWPLICALNTRGHLINVHTWPFIWRLKLVKIDNFLMKNKFFSDFFENFCISMAIFCFNPNQP